MKDFIIRTDSYTQENKIIDEHFFINHISQFRKNKIHIDCFGPNWCILFTKNVESLDLRVRSGNKYIVIESDKMVFCPPYALLETMLSPGTKVDFVTITSSWPLEEIYPNPLMLEQKKPFSLPETREQVLSLVQEFKKGEELLQQAVVSAVAEKLKKSLEKKYSQDDKINELAKELKISREVLTRSFKKAYNLTPIDYRHKLRIFEGLSLMNTGMPISEVTKSVGYSDAKQFIIQFKKHFKTTPKKFSPFHKNRT